ncbi:alpha-glucosidase C-terminal domain-containing protein, partial [Pseudomonas brassicacearum]
DSVLHHYRRLIALRRSESLITDGLYQQLLPEHPQVWAYVREGDAERLLVVNNFYGTTCEVELPATVISESMGQRLLISNYADGPLRKRQVTLRPYESFVVHLIDP